MSRLELSRGNKGLWQRVEALWRSMLPRQARVTRTDGGTVWVRFVDEGSDAPESQFPSTVAGVAAGTMGWVLTLGGNKGLFVAAGAMPETVFTAAMSSNTLLNTTHVGTAFSDFPTLYALSLSDIFPEMTDGIWDVTVSANALLYRSVATGGTYLGVGARDGSTHLMNGVALARNFPQTNGYTNSYSRTLTGLTRTNIIDIKYSGFSTAGTTYCVNHNATFTAVRTG